MSTTSGYLLCHNIQHNHALCSPCKRHLLPLHREVFEEDILFVKQLMELGIGIVYAHHVLKKQAGDLFLWDMV